MRKTLFVYRRKWFGSAQIRAFQIAEALGCDTMGIKQLTAEAARRYEQIVYVKSFAPITLLEQIRAQGIKQIFDPIDEYRWWKIWLRKGFVDAFIGANETHAFYLEQRFGAKATPLPHHHCNYEEQRIPEGRTPPTLGYIGNKTRWPLNRKIAAQLPLPLVTSGLQKEGRKTLPELYLSVDIGYEFRSVPMDIRYKPATKLVNFMSYGIPSVLPFEAGYTEVALHGIHCLYAHSPRDMVLLLNRLARDTELRIAMGHAGVEAARPFHITRVAQLYREFLSSF